MNVFQAVIFSALNGGLFQYSFAGLKSQSTT